MLFAICTPAIASEAQIGLALRILCGFGIDEVPEAFLSNKETINKRLFRAKEKLRSEKIELELPSKQKLLNASITYSILFTSYLMKGIILKPKIKF
jgi:RNA polymerase sigma-70 factor (ECF subfamily)